MSISLSNNNLLVNTNLTKDTAEDFNAIRSGVESEQDRNSRSVPRYNKVALAYADMLKRYDDMWNWYGHFTFRPGGTILGSVHPEKADKAFRHFIDIINKESFGRNYKKRADKGSLVARSTEIGGKGGLLHYHALLGHIPDKVSLLNKEYKEVWNGLSGFARIYQYDRSLGGAAYLSKSAYAWKRGEIDFIGPWGCVDKIMTESYAVPELFAVSVSQ